MFTHSGICLSIGEAHCLHDTFVCKQTNLKICAEDRCNGLEDCCGVPEHGICHDQSDEDGCCE